MVESALNKVRSIPRAKALQKVKKKAQRERPVLAIHYDPSSIARHWRTITSKDSHLNEVFKEPPLTAYRRQRNIRGHLIRAKVVTRHRE